MKNMKSYIHYKEQQKAKELINGFSRLPKEEKLRSIAKFFHNPQSAEEDFKSFWYEDERIQKLFDEFSENTISNYYFPYSIAPNFVIDGEVYHIPMVIEESSVVAAASKSAKFWANHGGFHTKIHSTIKVGQVHFTWEGDASKLHAAMPEMKERFIEKVKPITANMEERGGGIIDIELVDKTSDMDNYYQLKASFNTVDSMGANFINSCLEEFASELKKYVMESNTFTGKEKDVNVIMSILSNYTPDCIVEAWVECDIEDLGELEDELSGKEYAEKFRKGVQVAKVDKFRATTHNKGIFNGVDAVALATGNDFRAIEAAGHTFAARDGQYRGLTDLTLENGKFKYSLKLPLSMGTVGGLTNLHPLVKKSLQLLSNPKAEDLMRIAATAGLANNFGAVHSLVTKGIQLGHMKMHLLNILNAFEATEEEKNQAVKYFKNIKVSYSNVADFIKALRNEKRNRES